MPKKNSELVRQLSHYGFFRFTNAYWQATSANREAFLNQLHNELPRLAEKVYLYRIYPTRVDADLMIWSALNITNTNAPQKFFSGSGACISKWRKYLKPVDTLWGFTRPSLYSTGKSAQELDPFEPRRKSYLVVYPFTKTADWYLMSREERQAMMNEHIKTGRQYPEISQLLLYSTGLQDQEFVVVYETADLAHFSQLVSALRETEGRKYTLRDTPIYTAIYSSLEDIISEWA